MSTHCFFRTGRSHAPLALLLKKDENVTEPFNIAVIGCGTVGSGVVRLLVEQPERLAARAGRPLVLRRIVVRWKPAHRSRG